IGQQAFAFRFPLARARLLLLFFFSSLLFSRRHRYVTRYVTLWRYGRVHFAAPFPVAFLAFCTAGTHASTSVVLVGVGQGRAAVGVEFNPSGRLNGSREARDASDLLHVLGEQTGDKFALRVLV